MDTRLRAPSHCRLTQFEIARLAGVATIPNGYYPRLNLTNLIDTPMTWYAAHIIISRGELPESAGKIKVEESIYLVEAADVDAAFRKAEGAGVRMADAIRESWWTLSDGSKKMADDAQLLGIRKVVTLQSDAGDEDAPMDMTELTYSFFEMDDLHAARRLASGR